MELTAADNLPGSAGVELRWNDSPCKWILSGNYSRQGRNQYCLGGQTPGTSPPPVTRARHFQRISAERDARKKSVLKPDRLNMVRQQEEPFVLKCRLPGTSAGCSHSRAKINLAPRSLPRDFEIANIIDAHAAGKKNREQLVTPDDH